ncbi:DUF429 domain-containing protein [Desulfospira joergensenii]|uniref:DUF429 domain-containing protein n=1 Tax=Desulfospira joergensenii TaxID=53329 RepID=UPI0003B492BD|nr:DUF429 domain-containing protein [Desulfospira joergensenii]
MNCGKRQMQERFIGIDGCREGWFYVSLDRDRHYGFGMLSSIFEIEEIADEKSRILIDIPIGLREKESEERLCDKAARKVLGKKSSTIFPAPSRLSLDENDYAAASLANQNHTGRKLSKQSFYIMSKIREVDDFVRHSQSGIHFHEYHPELGFLALNRFKPLAFSKKKEAGQRERLEILAPCLASAGDLFEKAAESFLRRQVALDDILDAISGAVSATMYDQWCFLPAHPEMDSRGIPMKIVYPCGDR